VSVEEAGEALARVTQEAIAAEQTTLLLRDEHDRIRHVKTVGGNGEFERRLHSHVAGQAADDFRLWRVAARDAKPIFVENAPASRLLPPDLVEVLGISSYVAFPLLAEGSALGLVLASHTAPPRQWTTEDRRLVVQLALEGSLVVENAALRATEQERLDQLAHQAFHDSLTELPNRALFTDRLGLALARTNRRKASVAVLFLDLDDFKPINDRFGHDAGDRLLRSVAERLRACVRPEDTVARLGGDEFTVLLEDIVDVRYAIGVAERIEEALQEPFPIDGHEATVTASIGIAVSTGRVASPEDLMRNSDQAMYQAKRKGRARHILFTVGGTPGDGSAAVSPRVEEQLAVEEELAAEAAIEDAMVVEHAEAAPLDDATDDEREAPAAPPETAERAAPDTPTRHEAPGESLPDETLPSAAALTEARRRRRLRFPPRS
jgi:diguanylate cyclase (GGDEF)-like protein